MPWFLRRKISYTLYHQLSLAFGAGAISILNPEPPFSRAHFTIIFCDDIAVLFLLNAFTAHTELYEYCTYCARTRVRVQYEYEYEYTVPRALVHTSLSTVRVSYVRGYTSVYESLRTRIR